MNKQKVYLIIVAVFIIAIASIAFWWNPFSSQNSAEQAKKNICTHSWKCDWGPCVNGSQSKVAIDSNNCKAPLTGQVTCPKVTQACTGGK